MKRFAILAVLACFLTACDGPSDYNLASLTAPIPGFGSGITGSGGIVGTWWKIDETDLSFRLVRDGQRFRVELRDAQGPLKPQLIAPTKVEGGVADEALPESDGAPLTGQREREGWDKANLPTIPVDVLEVQGGLVLQATYGKLTLLTLLKPTADGYHLEIQNDIDQRKLHSALKDAKALKAGTDYVALATRTGATDTHIAFQNGSERFVPFLRDHAAEIFTLEGSGNKASQASDR